MVVQDMSTAVRPMSPATVAGSVSDTSAGAAKERRRKIFAGGNASKRHRDRVNIEFQNLAQLLPFPESVIARLDKSSILRLAVSYIRAKSFFKGLSLFEHEFREKALDSGSDSCSSDDQKWTAKKSPTEPIKEGTGVLSDIFSQALDGFLLVVTEDMRVLFVSDSVRVYLGYCQAGIIHENFLQFVNPADHATIHTAINYTTSELDEIKSGDIKKSSQRVGQGGQRTGCTSRILPRRFLCRMKCAFSCSSRFYTAYRTFSFSGHLRRSTIQEGQEQKTVNTLIVFGLPTTSNKCASIDVMQEGWDDKEAVGSDSDIANFIHCSSGFRIEPTLRPHVAPIPVTAADSDMPNATPILPGFQRSHLSSNTIPTVFPVDRLSGHPCAPFFPFPAPLPGFVTHKGSTGASVTSDSRFSDYSDDSRCSPASSPDVPWKPTKQFPSSSSRGGTSPDAFDPVYTFRLDVETENKRQFSRKVEIPRFASSENLIEDLYYKYRPKPCATNEEGTDNGNTRDPPMSDKCAKPASDDIFAGANVLMTLKNARTSPSTSPGPKSDRGITSVGKRCHESDSELSDSSSKRRKMGSSFNITALLGLDDCPQDESNAVRGGVVSPSNRKTGPSAVTPTSMNLLPVTSCFTTYSLESSFSWPCEPDLKRTSEWPYHPENVCQFPFIGKGLGSSDLLPVPFVKSLMSKS